MRATEPTLPVPKPGIMSINAYVAGESELPGDGPIARLAANEGALGASPLAVAAYQKAGSDLRRYPDGSASALRAKLAETFGLPQAQLVVGAGSDELISLLIKAYAGVGDEVLYSQHGFLMYKLSALTCGATPVAAPESNLRTSVQAMLGHVTERTRIVFVANPNNPTGSYLTGAELAALHAGLPSDCILAIDAAYSEFVDRPDYSDGSELVAAHDNVIMLRTFSKIFGLASLRVGWAYASVNIVDVLNRIRGPFNVGAAAQAAAVAALADQGHRAASQALNASELPRFVAAAEALGYELPPSVGNFVLLKAGKDVPALDAHFRSQRILTRQVGSYGLGDYLRITIGTPAEMDRVIAALASFPRSAA